MLLGIFKQIIETRNIDEEGEDAWRFETLIL